MKILIKIQANNDLLCHEALSMAFALASFEHDIQLFLGDYLVSQLIQNPAGKFDNMLSSLDLYDMPKAWVSVENFAKINENNTTLNCREQLCFATTTDTFDTTFEL